jgi:hypothetical protein
MRRSAAGNNSPVVDRGGALPVFGVASVDLATEAVALQFASTGHDHL